MKNKKYAEKLDNYDFSTKEGFNSVLLELRYKELAHFFVGSSCLEMGCADGLGTGFLLDHFDRIVAVDGSRGLLEKARQEISDDKVEIVLSLFEDLELEEKFDTVILPHVLEHVTDPLAVLQIAKKHLSETGVVLIDVPNAFSLHRQLGVHLGMLKNVYTLNDSDLSIGHQRVYDMKLLKKDAEKAGLIPLRQGGIFLKLFSNAQLEGIVDGKTAHGLNELGKKYPGISAEIYLICKKIK